MSLMSRTALLSALMAVPVLMLAGCKPATQDDTSKTATETTASADENAAPNTDAFDINTIPLSTAALGAFPYIVLPEGYSNERYGETKKDFARFPFWVNDKEHWVEGQFYGTIFSAVPGKDYSQFEVEKNFEALMKQMGAVQVGNSKIPSSVTDTWTDEINQGFIDGLGNVTSEPTKTWVIRRDDGNIWVHLVTNSASGAYIVGKEKPFKQTSSLIPASDLKKAIDASGKVALQVNFATDKTAILPESQPQIDQVAQLMTDDPALKLSVGGHTDNSGDKAHNQTLSEGRAQSVVSALTAKGIAANRLTAKGFGDTQPVADNGTEEGKAKNRRVELVKA